MKKLLLVSLCFLVLCITQVYAQNRTVTGTVLAKDDGLPVPGATVKVKGTAIGTQTSSNGKFTLSVPAGAVLQVSFLGYNTTDVNVGSSSVMNITLESNTAQLGEVVVTGALGIKRQAKEQGAAATNITNKTLTESHPTNFTVGLSAKAPGLVVSTLNNGINPSTRFTLRGNRHILGNNYALVVLNGVPISPNEVNTINPDDIESVNILNGAGAAALYGSDASNGALIITTTHGSPSGAPRIAYTNTFLFEKLAYLPSFQTKFGGYGGEGAPFQDPITGFITTPVGFENQSYGPAYNGKPTQLGIPLEDGTVQIYPYATRPTDPRRAFFVTGYSEENNISYSQGDANNSFNLSANNLLRKGITPDERFKRNSVRVSATKTYGIFKADFNANYVQSYQNSVGNGGYDGTALDGGRSLLSSLYNTPSWVPLDQYKDITKPFADVNTFYNSYGVNPYWIIKNDRVDTRLDHLTASFGAQLTPTKWFDVSYRLSENFGTGNQQFRRSPVQFSQYAISDPTGGFGTQGQSYGGATGHIPGQVQNRTQFGDGSFDTGVGPQGYSRIQQDIFAAFHHTFFNDFKVNFILGNSIWQAYLNQIQNNSTNLLVDNFYNIGSILGTPATSQTTQKIRQIGYFGDLTIGYKDYAFIEATLRNDHDSRLSNGLRSFWYPSVKGSLVFTEAIDALKGNKILNYGKIRASFSRVGSVNVSPYSTTNTFSPTGGFPYGNTGGLSLGTTLNNPLIKPELTQEIEFGTDLSFFNSRINASATYYKSNTRNQILPISVSPTTGYNQATVNIGEVQNTGYEFKLDVSVLTKEENNFYMNLGGNFTIQNSIVKSLTDGLPSITIASIGTGTLIQARVGQPFPILVGSDVNRDPQGRVIVDPITGYPSTNTTLQNLGQTVPKYLLGLTQTFSYKFVTLTATSEFRTGGVFYNASLQSATAAGVSAYSASADRQRFVFPNSVINTGTAAAPVYTPNTTVTIADGNQGFWNAGAFYNSTAAYTNSAAFWKLREANLAFDISQWARRTKYIKKASFAFVGRNLLMLRPKGQKFIDPEFSALSGNGTGIIDTYQLPPTRFFGASLNITF